MKGWSYMLIVQCHREIYLNGTVELYGWMMLIIGWYNTSNCILLNITCCLLTCILFLKSVFWCWMWFFSKDESRRFNTKIFTLLFCLHFSGKIIEYIGLKMIRKKRHLRYLSSFNNAIKIFFVVQEWIQGINIIFKVETQIIW